MKYLNKGFSLIELTMVLLILGIIIGMFKMPLSQVLENRRISETDLKIKETQNRLSAIQQALLGYVLVNSKLPCPSNAPDSGIADSSLCAQEGYLPYKDLGFQYNKDSWGSPICYRIDSAFSGVITANTNLADNLDIQDVQTSQSMISMGVSNPVIILYSAGSNKLMQNNQNTCQKSGKIYYINYASNSTDAQKDNILIYLSRFSMMYYLGMFNKI